MIRFVAHHPYLYTLYSTIVFVIAREVPDWQAAYAIIALFFVARIIMTWGGMRIQRKETECKSVRYKARYGPMTDG